MRWTYSVSALPLLSGKAVITEAEAVNEIGDASKYSVPWAQVAVLQNVYGVSRDRHHFCTHLFVYHPLMFIEKWHDVMMQKQL